MAAKKRPASSRSSRRGAPANKRKKAPAKKAPARKAPAKKARRAPAKKPAAKKPAAKKPAAKKPAAKEPAAKKPAAKKPAPKKLPPRKPATKEPAPSKAPAQKPRARRVAAKAPVARAAPTTAAAGRMPSARAQPLAARRAASLRRETPPRVPQVSAPLDDDAVPGVDLLGLGRGDERRRFQRVPKELKVRLFAGASRGGYLEARLESVDMSLSGIFLRSTFFLPEGTPVRVELDGAWGQTAEAQGTVARVQRDGERTGFGIHFEKLDRDTLRDLVGIFVGDRIERFVQTFSRQKGGSVDQEALWEGILAWELERLQRAMED